MGKNSPKKRKSESHDNETPKKVKLLDSKIQVKSLPDNLNKIKPESTNKNINPNISERQNENQKLSKSEKQQTNVPKNAQNKLKKFSGTASLENQVKSKKNQLKAENEINSDDESDYEVEQEIKPEKIAKSMNEDNDEISRETDDEEDPDRDSENPQSDEIDNTKIEKTPNKVQKKEKNEQKPKCDTEKLKSFIQKESKSGKKRYVLFLGNLAYDTTTEDIKNHFQKGCKIVNVRLPKHKETNKPRGFGYLDVADNESYLKGFSMHHTFIKGRRINVEYTSGGKKNSVDMKKLIKKKNFKLHALRKEGKVEGFKKQHPNKRSVRRAKKRAFDRKN